MVSLAGGEVGSVMNMLCESNGRCGCFGQWERQEKEGLSPLPMDLAAMDKLFLSSILIVEWGKTQQQLLFLLLTVREGATAQDILPFANGRAMPEIGQCLLRILLNQLRSTSVYVLFIPL